MFLENIYTSALKAIRKGASGRRFLELRNACEAASPLSFHPLQLACESRSSRLMTVALDCLQKLIAYGYLRGEQQINEVVETICRCNNHPDDNVQLQVIKALLTAVTCTTCDVHGTSLLLAVRACYHIHLVSKNAVNKATAKATLTQMLNIVFQRMEQSSDTLSAKKAQRARNREGGAGGDVPSMFCGTMYPAVYSVVGFASPTPPGNAVSANCEGLRPIGAPINTSQMYGAHAAVQAPFATILHKDAFLLFRALCKLSMKTHQGAPERAHRGDHGDMNLTTGRGDGGSVGDEPDPIALKSKLLALELLLSVLEHSGPRFRNGPKFIVAIKHYLCSSLIKNCVSPVTQVVGLSLRIFAALQVQFLEF